jgi:hypothetical protein
MRLHDPERLLRLTLEGDADAAAHLVREADRRGDPMLLLVAACVRGLGWDLVAARAHAVDHGRLSPPVIDGLRALLDGHDPRARRPLPPTWLAALWEGLPCPQAALADTLSWRSGAFFPKDLDPQPWSALPTDPLRDEDGARLLSMDWSHIQGLSLIGHQLGEQTVRALASSPTLRGLQTLNLTRNPLPYLALRGLLTAPIFSTARDVRLPSGEALYRAIDDANLPDRLLFKALACAPVTAPLPRTDARLRQSLPSLLAAFIDGQRAAFTGLRRLSDWIRSDRLRDLSLDPKGRAKIAALLPDALCAACDPDERAQLSALALGLPLNNPDQLKLWTACLLTFTEPPRHYALSEDHAAALLGNLLRMPLIGDGAFTRLSCLRALAAWPTTTLGDISLAALRASWDPHREAAFLRRAALTHLVPLTREPSIPFNVEGCSPRLTPLLHLLHLLTMFPPLPTSPPPAVVEADDAVACPALTPLIGQPFSRAVIAAIGYTMPFDDAFELLCGGAHPLDACSLHMFTALSHIYPASDLQRALTRIDISYQHDPSLSPFLRALAPRLSHRKPLRKAAVKLLLSCEDRALQRDS